MSHDRDGVRDEPAQPRRAFGVAANPPHPATVAQPRRAFGVAANPPHPATVAQPRRAFGVAANPPHPATVVQPRRAFGAVTPPPHAATVLQPRPLALPRPPSIEVVPAGRSSFGESRLLVSQPSARLIQRADFMDLEVDSGRKGFGRPDFKSGISKVVTDGVNAELTSGGFNPVLRSNFDVAHKVPFEAIRNAVMSYIYVKGSHTYDDIRRKTEALYTVDKSRRERMRTFRRKLGGLVDKYGSLDKGTMLIIDAANALLEELNSAPDNLGLGFPTENRSIGAFPDPVILEWNKKTKDVTFSPRSDAIDDEWNLLGNLLYDSSGRPRSSQVTTYYY